MSKINENGVKSFKIPIWSIGIARQDDKKYNKREKALSGSENAVKSSIKSWLEIHPNIVHVDRLNSGKVCSNGQWIQLCKEGTPDLYAILNCHNLAHFLFIECKSSSGRQSISQKIFENNMKHLKNVHYILAYSPEDVNKVIKEIV